MRNNHERLPARWLRQALPYAVEELLAEDVEQLHLALGEALADGRHLLLAVRRDLLKGWLAQLMAVGITVSAIYVDADLLPREGIQVLLHGERGLLGGAGELRMAFAASDWPNLADACSEAPLLRCVIVRTWCCPWKSFASSASAWMMPQACL